MNKSHVLIVEDEDDIASILKLNLEADGFQVSVLNDGQHVLDYIRQHRPDIVLLDVMIPEKDGFEVCKEIKADPDVKATPVIFLTAKTLEHNVISGLEIGADDYITKPFSISVVITRIKTVLRRTIQARKPVTTNDQTQLSLAGIQLDPIKMVVKTDAGKVEMNATEFMLLKFLMSKPGWVFKRTQLMEACKGEDSFVTDRSIDVIMVSIRKKLGAHAHLIQTVRGVGYKFKDIES
ncbi:MAG: response regulator [Candidatus Margulisiibacteriota bacterium]